MSCQSGPLWSSTLSPASSSIYSVLVPTYFTLHPLYTSEPSESSPLLCLQDVQPRPTDVFLSLSVLVIPKTYNKERNVQTL